MVKNLLLLGTSEKETGFQVVVAKEPCVVKATKSPKHVADFEQAFQKSSVPKRMLKNNQSG